MQDPVIHFIAIHLASKRVEMKRLPHLWLHGAMISYHVVIGMRDTLYVAREIVPPINVAEFYPRTIHFASVPIEPTL